MELPQRLRVIVTTEDGTVLATQHVLLDRDAGDTTFTVSSAISELIEDHYECDPTA